MAANLSPRRRASLVLAQPVRHLAAGFLGITYRCGHTAWLHAPALAAYAPDLTLAAALRRLRCIACGSPRPGWWQRGNRLGALKLLRTLTY